eukprot:scaffold85342_cov54-Phaeocystis_antarctica.AAC.3
MAASVTKLGRYQTKVDAAIRAVNDNDVWPHTAVRYAGTEPDQGRAGRPRWTRKWRCPPGAHRPAGGSSGRVQAELRPRQAG